ncbi:MAG: protein kinase [Myxococcales bacterium]|nr:protein kinase [Myxococcales bacterium]
MGEIGAAGRGTIHARPGTPGIESSPAAPVRVSVMAEHPAPSASAPAADESAVWPASVRLEHGVFESRYRVIRSLGDGGMGEVVLAEHLSLGKRVAIKLMHPQYVGDEVTEQRFLLETRAAARIHHDNVVGITDFGRTADGRMFFVMEYLDGEDLARTLRREGPLPWRRALHMVWHVTRAMGEAHRRGVIHRDIKPGNCFRVTCNGDPDWIKVLDFGLAKFFRKQDLLRGPVTQAGVVLGTPGYMAPELEAGMPPDPRVDLYSIGVLLVRLMTGKLPDEGGMKLLAEQADAPLALHKLLAKALREDPDERFQTAEGLEEAIEYVVASAGGKRPVTANKVQAPASVRPAPARAPESAPARAPIEPRKISTPKGPPLAQRQAEPRPTQQMSSGALMATIRATTGPMLPAVRATPVSVPAVRATPVSVPAVRATPASVPAVRATPVSVPAVRGATGPLPAAGRPSVLRVVLIALVFGALAGGVMAVWMHMSQETAKPQPVPQPQPQPVPQTQPVAPAPVQAAPAPAPPAAAEAVQAEPAAAAEAKPSAPSRTTRPRRAKRSNDGALGLKNPFSEK